MAGRDARLGGEGGLRWTDAQLWDCPFTGTGGHEFTADIKMGSFPYRACVVAW